MNGRTLTLDLGATRLKGAVLDAPGSPVAEPAWEPTKTPCDPDGFLGQVALLMQRLPEFDRVSIGFPGVVRAGRVLTAPLFWGVAGPGSPEDPRLVARSSASARRSGAAASASASRRSGC